MVDAGSSNSSKKGSPLLTHFSPRKLKAQHLSGSLQKKERISDTNMTTAVSMNRTEIPLKGGSGSDSIRSCQTSMDDKPRYDIKSTIMRGNANNVSGSTTHQRNTMDQTITNRQPIHTAGHSYSSDSDVAPNTMMMTTTTAATTTSSATAMRRLYFKSAKLSKTTQNSITTGQQAQHVPKVHIQF